MPFVFAPISFQNAGADLRCLATQNPTGSRQSASCSPRRVAKVQKTPAIMERALADLARALRERLVIIHDEQSRTSPEVHMERLRAVSEKIEKLQTALQQQVDPRLAHYLQRRSYEKALEFIESL